MVYCTCSFAPEENELVIDQQLRQLGGCVEVVPMDLPVPAQPGLTQWRDRGLDAQLQLARRILPAGPLQAFFLCQLRKNPASAGAAVIHL